MSISKLIYADLPGYEAMTCTPLFVCDASPLFHDNIHNAVRTYSVIRKYMQILGIIIHL